MTDSRSEVPQKPCVILVNPQMGENIGAVARAMANCALGDLRLVCPRDGWPNPKARYMASGADSILDAARLCDTTAEASRAQVPAAAHNPGQPSVRRHPRAAALERGDLGHLPARAPGSHYLLAMVAAAAQQLKGDKARALHWSKNARRRRSDASVERYFQAFPYQNREHRDRMERALKGAGF